MDNKILGKMEIAANGICKKFSEFTFTKKKLDCQLFASFLHVLKMILDDYFGEELQQINTLNYKIVFLEKKEDLCIYIVEKEFSDYSSLKQDIKK
ncbi:MAG: hypothetical protein ACTSPY_04895 [Candidatus Helarchaeota archaeon]